MSVVSNIKNRLNKQNVQRLLKIINQKFLSINTNTNYLLGLLIYVGKNEYGDEIIEFIEPDIKIDIFYYSCANKFNVQIAKKYIGKTYLGSIIFVNGDECLAYQFDKGGFVKIFGINGNLVKRHKKGGFSANRFARIAEESRHLYVTRIIDRLKDLNTDNNWIFGSNEIIQLILKRNLIKLQFGGFLEFNNNTISNNKYWIEFLGKKNNYDSKYKEILDFLTMNPDMLDFEPLNKHTMKYYIDKNNQSDVLNTNQIPLDITSKYYSQLVIFDYIGVKFYNYLIDDCEY